MKKKQGFTLIELLAVIVVLAVIALIATPLVLNIIERAEKGAFRDSVYGIMEAAEFQVILDGSKYPITYVFPSDNGRIKFKGTKPSEGYLQIVNEGKMKLALGNGRWCATKSEKESQVTIKNGHCEKVDFDRPIISGYGDLNQEINVGDRYILPNVVAVDKEGNPLNITTTIKQGDKIVDSIDTTKEGTFTITYMTEPDSQGNTATVTITIQVTKLPPITDKLIGNGTKNGDLEQVEDTYYYQGSNPNNWIQFKDVNDENALWRIISIENSVIKIIRNQSLGPMAWDQTGGKYGNPSWTRPADIHTYLNETYYNSLPSIIKNQLEDTKFYIGIVGYSSTHATSSSIRGDERKTTWVGKVGLMNASDYLYATPKENTSCRNKAILNTDCKNDNWLFQAEYYQWTMNATNYDTSAVLDIYKNDGRLGVGCGLHNQNDSIASPVIHLKSNVKIIAGNGSESSPYMLQL